MPSVRYSALAIAALIGLTATLGGADAQRRPSSGAGAPPPSLPLTPIFDNTGVAGAPI